MIFKLGAYLRRDGICPLACRYVQIITKYFREAFGLDEGFVDVPRETISYSMGVGFKFDANRNKRRSVLCMLLNNVW